LIACAREFTFVSGFAPRVSDTRAALSLMCGSLAALVSA